MDKFRELMKKKRVEKGYSQYKLGTLVGIQQTSINHIEKGRRDPSYEVLLKICEVLEIPLFGEVIEHNDGAE